MLIIGKAPTQHVAHSAEYRHRNRPTSDYLGIFIGHFQPHGWGRGGNLQSREEHTFDDQVDDTYVLRAGREERWRICNAVRLTAPHFISACTSSRNACRAGSRE